MNLHVRLGPADEKGWQRGAICDLLRAIPEVSERTLSQAKPCDALETLSLLMHNQFDIVHYAGHGVFEPGDGRRGWVFNKDCVITAKEIFKIHQVPRLVFANACLSSRTLDSKEALPQVSIQQVGLAEAFFARGIENYIGAGWKVDDDEAEVFALDFYLAALGVGRTPEGAPKLNDEAPPGTLGEALAEARLNLVRNAPKRVASGVSKTWGAYQHYGRVNAKLLPFSNKDAESINLISNSSSVTA